MLNKEGRPKWKHIGKKSTWLYPLYCPHNDGVMRDVFQDETSLILVESIGDLLSCHQHKIYNTAVSFGLDISPLLICEMLEINPERIIISFNNDTGKDANRGLEGAVKNFLKLLNHFDPHKLLICLPTKNDFGDMSDTDFKEWEDKRASLKSSEQHPKIRELANSMHKDGKLSKNLLKNTKLLQG